MAWAHGSKPILPEQMSSGVLGPKQQARLYTRETRVKTCETKCIPSSQEGECRLRPPSSRHLIYNRLKGTTTHTTPKVAPLNRRSGGMYGSQTNQSSLNKRKNGRLCSYQQHCLPLKEYGMVTQAQVTKPIF